MHFCDEALVYLKSGSGGDGKVGFLRARARAKGGPDGGNGGKGGNVVLIADINARGLLSFKHKKHFAANDGQGGKGKNSKGKDGTDLYLRVPVGTQVYDKSGKTLLMDLTLDKQSFILLEGGKGGAGNACFKSSTNRTPRERTLGQKGQEMYVRLRLKLFADFALVGLANAGKSSFLSTITNSNTKVADYPFSTTSPQLGTLYFEDQKYVVADMPGLIEGASSGKGLGFEFLRHIERCKALIHLLDSSSKSIEQDYESVREELKLYNPSLLNKPSIVCLTKCDLVNEKEAIQKRDEVERLSKRKVLLSSICFPETIEAAMIEAISAVKE